MKKSLALILFFSTISLAFGWEKIVIGNGSSNLEERVKRLEQAVIALQTKVYNQDSAQTSGGDSWVCRHTRFDKTAIGYGGSKAVAWAKMLENCEQKGMDFCDSGKCEQ